VERSPVRRNVQGIQAVHRADPSENWYQGEIGFDFYIIPVAKLKDCGVFGVSSDEELRLEESAGRLAVARLSKKWWNSFGLPSRRRNRNRLGSLA
jgi:hypothetical protein